MTDSDIKAEASAWINDPAIADADKTEIKALIAAGADGLAELTDRFYKSLDFGTGGLRGVIGAGLNRMNLYTVGAAAQGLANYIKKQGEPPMAAGVAIAYDCRRMSPEFALRTALVMSGNGINAFLFPRLRPTPTLSFAVRHLGCIAGVVVTASHNPPEYNGFKVYWRDGAQVVPPHDRGIIEEVRNVGGFENVRADDERTARANLRLKDIGADVDEAYLKSVTDDCLVPDLVEKNGKDIKIVFSSLHGTGGEMVPEALKRRGFSNVISVAEQAEPDGEFPTVASPNPEEAAAWELPLAYARKHKADLVIATDPDADRVGAAVPDADGDYHLLTGNRIAALLTEFICAARKETDNMPKQGVVLSTVVSSDQMKDIARDHGCEVIETLTGFKWIAEQIGKFDEPDDERVFLFGAEESYGYLPSAKVRDKDAVASAAFLADAVAFAKSQGQSLWQLLETLYQRHGYFEEFTKSITLKGKSGADQIKHIMSTIRVDPPRELAGDPVLRVADLSSGEVRDAKLGTVVDQFRLPPADVVMLMTANCKLIARPSGTEPKIKFYVLVRAQENDIVIARADAKTRIESITATVIELVDRVTAGGSARLGES